ncbi:PIF1-like helicase-domain-containing protein, partial [Desarmillaria tabescens]
LHLIDKLLRSHGRHLSEWTQMPASTMDWAAYEDNPLLAAQLAYDIPSLRQLVNNNLQTFNAEQREAYDIVVESATHQQGRSVFLHSAGGGEKTFVCNTIAAAVHAQGQIVLTCASSGISAVLLAGGCTSHSTFKIPIPSRDDTTCSIRRGTHLAELLCQTALII